jgi:adenylate cyclase
LNKQNFYHEFRGGTGLAGGRRAYDGAVSEDAYLEANINGQMRRFPLPPDRACLIGRSEKNTIVIDDDEASRNHAMLQADTVGFLLTDRNSSNGTLVNGVRISVPIVLRHGDQIDIGTHHFTFYQRSAIQPAAPEIDELASTNVVFAEKLITVLVVDIRDFTGLAQRTEAGNLAQMSRTFFGEAGRLLLASGSAAQKYIGDAVMAYWLHQNFQPQLSELIAVLESVARLSETAASLQDRFQLDDPIRIGAGVNTGRATVGNVGSIASTDHTVMGEVVNKTFRLESATKEIGCDLLLGEDTWRFLAAFTGHLPQFQERPVTLKGYGQPVAAWGASMESLKLVLAALPGTIKR